MVDENATNPLVVGRDGLEEVSYDPFDLMPDGFTPPPRCLVSEEDVSRTRRSAGAGGWARAGRDRLLDAVSDPLDLPDAAPNEVDSSLCSTASRRALRLALAHVFTGEEGYRDESIRDLRWLARLYLAAPVREGGARLMGCGLAECRFAVRLAQTYDLLAAGGLEGEDDGLSRRTLRASRQTAAAHRHLSCGNHNTWTNVALLVVGVALGDRQCVHDALYGHAVGERFRYGLVHHLRHDILSDGMHWERTVGYHFYTLMGLAEAARQMELLGVDLWHAELPAQMSSDGADLHPAYGPEGTRKCLKAAFDAPFYLAFPGGDLTLLHDSGLANLRGVHVWGIIYELAWEAYRDPKYAWVLNKIDRDYSQRDMPSLPKTLSASCGVVDFARLKRASYPEGNVSLAEDRDISTLGRLREGCSLFPVTGQAVLRAAPDAAVPAAYLFWGPHRAGHQNPAALHLDVHSGRRRVTAAPRTAGYSDPLHLTWQRTTVAHNTVTVDRTPMFPYDQGNEESIWWRDEERGRPSDGRLEQFRPEGPTRLVRASNDRVYPGVRLDRMVAVERDFVLDVYRVLSEESHCYDWTVHCVGAAPGAR